MVTDSFSVFNNALHASAEETQIHTDNISLLVARVDGPEPGVVFEHRADEEMQAASLGKLPIELARRDHPNITPNDSVQVAKDLIVPGSGFLQFFGERDYSVEELTLALLRFSDNTAAGALIFNVLGGVRSVNLSLGRVLGKNPVTGLIDVTHNANRGFEHGLTTAREIATVMRALQSKELSKSYPPYGIIDGYHGETGLQPIIKALERVQSYFNRYTVQEAIELAHDDYQLYVDITSQFPEGRLALKNGYYDDTDLGLSVNHQVVKSSRYVVASMIQTALDPAMHEHAEQFHFGIGQALYQASTSS